MTSAVLTLLIAIFAASAAYAEALSPGVFVVDAGTLNVRSDATTVGKVTDKLARGQEVQVYEVRDGWARISRYHDGASEGLSGKVARWVFAAHLSAKTPAIAKVDINSPIFAAIESSEDLDKYQDIFAAVSERLVKSGECKLSDFKDIGGWWRSAAHKNQPVYYTYCGDTINNHPVYVNAATGETFR